MKQIADPQTIPAWRRGMTSVSLTPESKRFVSVWPRATGRTMAFLVNRYLTDLHERAVKIAGARGISYEQAVAALDREEVH